MITKEIAKFVAGVALWETLVHVTLALGKFTPVTIFGFTITSNINTILIIFPAITMIALVYYAWFTK